jgi:hypothetical protein
MWVGSACCQAWQNSRDYGMFRYRYRNGKVSTGSIPESFQAGLAIIHNFADRSLLIPIPRMGTLSDWPFRRGAPLRSPIKIFFGGAPRLSNQSDRVSILGARLSSQLQTVFFPSFTSLLLPPIIEMRECLKHWKRSGILDTCFEEIVLI